MSTGLGFPERILKPDGPGGYESGGQAGLACVRGGSNFGTASTTAILGDNGAQLAWNSETVTQTAVSRTEQIAPGFEAIAQAVVRTLEQLPVVGLPEDDQREAEAAANEVLVEITQPEPELGKIRRGIAALKGFLAGVVRRCGVRPQRPTPPR
jgi:hypothetical protein